MSRTTKILLVIVLVGASLTLLTGQAVAFVDVESHWAEKDILILASRGIVIGYNPDEFRPDKLLTRGELAVMISTALGLEEHARVLDKAAPSFTDVSADHWARGYIEVAREYGLVKGYETGIYKPNQGITREELAVILAQTWKTQAEDRFAWPVQLEQKGKSFFPDSADISSWAEESVSLVADLGIIKGFEDRTIRPREFVTRAQAAVLLNHLLAARGEDYQFYGLVSGGDPHLSRLEVQVGGQTIAFAVAEESLFFDRGKKGDWRDLDIYTPVFFNVDAQGKINFLATAKKNYSVPVFRVAQRENASWNEGAQLPDGTPGQEQYRLQHRVSPVASAGNTGQGEGSGLGLTPELTGKEIKAKQLKEQLNVAGRGIKVAIVDSGIDPGHPDLQVTPAGRPKIVEYIDVTEEGLVRTTGDHIKWGTLSLPGLVNKDLTVALYAGNSNGQFDRVLVGLPGDPGLRKFSQEAGEENFRQTISARIASGEVAVLGNQSFVIFAAGGEIISVPDGEQVLNMVVTEIDGQGNWVRFAFDGNGHGTHVAGIIGANGTIAGIAPAVELVIVKALDTQGESDVATIKKGIARAVESGARLVNLSLGYQLAMVENEEELTIYIEMLAREQGIIFVAAAGNNGPGTGSVATPGNAAGVITVGAYISPAMWQEEYGLKLPGDILWSFSASGPSGYWGVKPDVIAPGVVRSTFSLQAGNGYYLDEGTSMAAPHVTGILALILEAGQHQGKSFSPDELKLALQRGAVPTANLSFLEQGYGKVDALAAWHSLAGGEPAGGGFFPAAISGGYYLGDQLTGYLYLRQFTPGILDFTLTNFSETEEIVTLSSKVSWLTPHLTELRLPPHSMRTVPVYFAPGADLIKAGDIETGLLTVALGSGYEVDVVNTLIRPLELTAGQLTAEGRLPAGGMERSFIQVAANTSELAVALRILQSRGGNPLGRARLHLFDPDGREWEVSSFLGAGQLSGRLAATIIVPFPRQGVWEVVVAGSSWLDFYDLPETQYILSLSAQQVTAGELTGETGKKDPWVIGMVPARFEQVTLEAPPAPGKSRVLWVLNSKTKEYFEGLALVNNTVYQVKKGKLLVHSRQLTGQEVIITLFT